ncbi:MAG: acetylornithine transaminase [Deltaproteobacteria bacterium]|nr:MAG: acetylornithine transaminase [Deltaproteobacteria bacterium]
MKLSGDRRALRARDDSRSPSAHLRFLTQNFVMNTYNRLPLVLTKGKGAYVWDADGKKYLDFFSGLAVNNLGHCHPKIVAAIRKQASELLHVSNVFHIPTQSMLAEELVRHSFGDKVFFCNSGAEANEGAIKLARKYSYKKFGMGRHEVITMKNSFHGRTLAMITATGQEKYQKGFDPLMPGFQYAVFGDLESIKNTITEKTCAILIEPIQGEGGVKMAPPEYFQALRKLCDEKDILLIFDEVQTGVGRTGKLFAYEYLGIEPDIMTLAKGLASGVPIGALVATDKIAQAFEPGDHASTFGGNPLSTATALATLKTIYQDDLLENAQKMGKYLCDQVRKLSQKLPSMILEVRNRGLMIAIELSIDAKQVALKAIEMGLLINAVQEKTLRILPPLTVTKKQVDEFIGKLAKSIRESKQSS